VHPTKTLDVRVQGSSYAGLRIRPPPGLVTEKIHVTFRKANSILINQPYFKVGKQQECSSGKQEARTSAGISLKPESGGLHTKKLVLDTLKIVAL
jgi:hypothetical protein